MPDSAIPAGPAPWISDTMKLWFGRTALTLAVAGVGYLQTGQWQIQSTENARDTDTVALIKLAAEQEAEHHKMQLRIQALEIKLSMLSAGSFALLEMEPVAVDAPSPKALLNRARAKVSPDEVDIYQRSR